MMLPIYYRNFPKRKQKVIDQIDDKELVADINELLEYDENTAGGLMAKELVKVYETWTMPDVLENSSTSKRCQKVPLFM